MSKAHILGFPRIGEQRELKKALESYWKGTISQEELLKVGRELRLKNWQLQKESGLAYIQVGDFAWYDNILNLSIYLAAVPARFKPGKSKGISLDDMFRMGRGRAPSGAAVPACAMTKWFDTNYHYIVPELEPEQKFKAEPKLLLEEIEEAKQLGSPLKLVLPGPLTYLFLAKAQNTKFDCLDLVPSLVPAYKKILAQVAKLLDPAKDFIQVDEPILSLDLAANWQAAFKSCYAELAKNPIPIMLASYFGALEANLNLLLELPVAAVHLDAVRGKSDLEPLAKLLPAAKIISLGIIDGRNIWKNDLSSSLALLEPFKRELKDRLWVATSCSLLHCPVNLETETKINPDITPWLAFAKQKLTELVNLGRALDGNRDEQFFAANSRDILGRKESPLRSNPRVLSRARNSGSSDIKRHSAYPERARQQRAKNKLPLYPTTTIGSFPQTAEIRKVRRDFKQARLSEADYTKFMKNEIKHNIAKQEAIGLDVLVHGEPERNDMVEYFGEMLDGYAFTSNAWVQSYGSRCVKPPIIYGDVSRSQAMTTKWSSYAQSIAKKPVKAMLTGPITMLTWSFVRDDMSRDDVCTQIALALQDEVLDLEQINISHIQIDEPAIREAMPLRKSQRQAYLDWAVKCFHISANAVEDTTCIHTHMCYSDFNDIIEHIAALDADVISIETSRSRMQLLDSFKDYAYPNEIGPGVYDIHSPNVPELKDMLELIEQASKMIPAQRLWVNPDCGLKTRKWEETEKALKNMCRAAEQLRRQAS